MASFNLGRIKGEKGEAGISGERGEKGERGAQGAQGVMGFTPVFEVKEVITAENGESARVELDSSDIKKPLLTFYVPKGKDGKDALGDMISSIYDSKGKRCDIFEYADMLSISAMKKSGGEFSGKVKAYSMDEQELCVRNIVVAKSFPEDARLGDICIVTKSKSSITIGEQEIGTKLIVMENGIETPYLIVDKNIFGEGMVGLIRNEILPVKAFYDRAGSTDYCLSSVDLFLETIYPKSLENKFVDKLVKINITNTGRRRIFLPANGNLLDFEYFKENSRAAKITGGTHSAYWIRGLYNNLNTIINSQGEAEGLRVTERCGYRPMLVLNSETCVENIEFESKHAVRLPDEKCGIYIFDGEQWKECISLDN